MHLNRPKYQWQKKQKYLQSNLEKHPASVIKRKTQNNSQALPRNKKPRYSIRAIVDNFHKYKQEQSLESNYIQIKTAKISYAEMFVEINSQDLNELSPHQRIYWGQAKLYDNKSHYNILFSDHLVLDGEKKRPSIYISHEMIEAAFCSRLIKKKIQKLSNNSIYCFVYSLPFSKHINGKNYINFYVKNLDLLEIKEEF